MNTFGLTSTAELLARFEARLQSEPALSLDLVRPTAPGPAARSEPDPLASARWSYRQAAAVLERFRPADLRPLDPALRVASPYGLLLGDIQPAGGGLRDQLFELRPEVRRAALERLGSRDAMLAALAANPDRWRGDSQELYESWLQGSPPPLQTQSYRELTISKEIRKWLDGLVEGLPSAQTLLACLAHRDLSRSYEHLLTQGFVGRTRELQRLRDYVGVLPADSHTEAVKRQLRAWFKLERRAPLVIHAPGGMGKSALVGQFLEEHAQLPEAQRFPFAYLALDNASLRVAEPFTLVIEAMSQLQSQFHAREDEFRDLKAFVHDYRDRQSRVYWNRAGETASQNQRLAKAEETNTELYQRFGALLHQLCRRQDSSTVFAPALLVIDTFEEAQYRDQEHLLGLWKMLAIVQDAHPTLRVVISGRSPVAAAIGDMTAEELPLGELDPKSAEALLRMQGVGDLGAARRIVGEFGGNPLTLKLAARAWRAEPELGTATGLAGINTRRFGLFSLSGDIIRGQLYRRILDHIHDPEVQQLAHPGMVLRGVTPVIIIEVLAEPCGIDVPDQAKAERLFDELARESAFVTLDADGSLHYRPEIRQPMLKLLEQSKPAQVRAIHRAAIGHYARSDALADRAEEIYHRLALDQEPDELAERWLEGCGDYLGGAVAELPARAVAWLASWADLEVPRALLAGAHLADWERNVARKLLSLLRHRAASEALKLLGERPERSPASPLFALEARVWWLLDDNSAALAALDRGLESSPATANLGRVAELLWMKAQTLLLRADRSAAADALAQAERVAEAMPRPLCRFQILTGLVQLLRSGGEPERARLNAARTRLAAVYSELEPDDLTFDRSLTRAALAGLGADFPAAFRRGLQAVGLGRIDPESQQPLLAQLRQRFGDNQRADLDQAVLLALDQSPEDQDLLTQLAAVLDAQGYSLAGANLAGIEEYREPWETQNAPEVLA